jgi:hypothetical protein
MLEQFYLATVGVGLSVVSLMTYPERACVNGEEDVVMGIGDSITMVSCLAGLMVALPALLVFLSIIFSRTTLLASLRLRQGVILPFCVGFPIFGIGVPAAILTSLGSVFQLCGSIAFLLLFLWGFVGLASVSRMMGSQLGEQTGLPDNVVLETASGATLLSFAIAFPIVGWLLVFPLALVAGVGATVLSVWYRLSGVGEPARLRKLAPVRESEFEVTVAG